MPDMYFTPGDVVLRRFFQHHRLSRALATRVVSHDEQGLLLWTGTGYPSQEMVMADGRSLHDVTFQELITSPRVLRPKSWPGDGLIWHSTATPYAVWWFFDATGRHTTWYVNLEVPGVAWRDGGAAGIDTVDWDLDIVVQPDRTWEWKDEDEFVEGLAYGDLYWVKDEAEVRTAGAHAVKLIEAGEFPFDGTWSSYRPDPSWAVPPRFPAGWDRPRFC
jgi:hypothetical protein